MKKFEKLSKAEMKNVLGGGPGGVGEACVAACDVSSMNACGGTKVGTCYLQHMTICIADCNTMNQQ